MVAKCKKCGKCCEVLIIKLPPFALTSVAIEFYKARGCKIKQGYISIPYRCPHLNAENRCDIYEKRPQNCRTWFCKNSKNPFKP